MITRIIFIDVDGVLTSIRTGWYNMDIYSVNFLRWVCGRVDAKIVISSSWRYNHGFDFWKPIFENYLHDDFKTPDLRRKLPSGLYVGHIRGNEVEAWLNNHPETDEYLILDDDKDMLEDQLPNYIQTDSLDGMLSEHMDAIRKFFNIEDYPNKENHIYQHENMFCRKKK